MERDNRKPMILIVDDVPINIQVLTQSLKDPYHVKVATTGAKALEIAVSETPPDLILLDIIMPGMDGYEICRRLKSEDRTRSIPVIFITVQDRVEHEMAGLELGAVDYITKPFELPIVQARVRTHLELKRKTDMLEELAFMDGLTSIGNRRRFDETLPREWRRCGRKRLPVSLVMMDVDSFKPFNDHYGHAPGDECLRQVARTLERALLRGGDLVIRYGGEEFVAVLPETDPEGALCVAERMRLAVEQLAILHEFSRTDDVVTLSFGVATVIPSKEGSPSELIEAADEMVYAAKEAGGNQCRAVVLE